MLWPLIWTVSLRRFLNRLIETVQIRGHNILFLCRINKIIPNITKYSSLSRALRDNQEIRVILKMAAHVLKRKKKNIKNFYLVSKQLLVSHWFAVLHGKQSCILIPATSCTILMLFNLLSYLLFQAVDEFPSCSLHSWLCLSLFILLFLL